MDKKGVSVFISHVIAIAILFVVLTVVSSQLYSYYYDIKEESQRSQSRILSQKLSDNIITLYTNYKNSDYIPKEGNETLSEIFVNVPDKISGNNYELSLISHSKLWVDGYFENETTYQNKRPYAMVRVETEGNPSNVFDYPIYNVIIDLDGSVRRATKIRLSYVRENINGNKKDSIKLERIF